jgi:YesN/AraC family two-component response regulator
MDLLGLFKEALQMVGYENVCIFTDPTEAFNYIKKNSNDFELVISDFKMPGMNGCEHCTRLRKLNPNLNFIIISGYDYIPTDSSNFKLIKNQYRYLNS